MLEDEKRQHNLTVNGSSTPAEINVEQRRQPQRPPNKRQREHDPVIGDYLSEVAAFLGGVALGAGTLEIEADARAYSARAGRSRSARVRLAADIRAIRKSRKLIAEWGGP